MVPQTARRAVIGISENQGISLERSVAVSGNHQQPVRNPVALSRTRRCSVLPILTIVKSPLTAELSLIVFEFDNRRVAWGYIRRHQRRLSFRRGRTCKHHRHKWPQGKFNIHIDTPFFLIRDMNYDITHNSCPQVHVRGLPDNVPTSASKSYILL